MGFCCLLNIVCYRLYCCYRGAIVGIDFIVGIGFIDYFSPDRSGRTPDWHCWFYVLGLLFLNFFTTSSLLHHYSFTTLSLLLHYFFATTRPSLNLRSTFARPSLILRSSSDRTSLLWSIIYTKNADLELLIHNLRPSHYPFSQINNQKPTRIWQHKAPIS